MSEVPIRGQTTLEMTTRRGPVSDRQGDLAGGPLRENMAENKASSAGYGGTSLIKNASPQDLTVGLQGYLAHNPPPPVGPYSSRMSRDLW